MAITTAGLEVGSELADSSSRPGELLPIGLWDIGFGLREVDERMAEHTVAIVLLIMILRAQKVIVVLAMDKFAKESRGCPFGPRVALEEPVRIAIGVGQYDDDGVRMMNSSYQMSRLVSTPRQRWRK